MNKGAFFVINSSVKNLGLPKATNSDYIVTIIELLFFYCKTSVILLCACLWMRDLDGDSY